MRVKEVNATANLAWSPADQPVLRLAAGTAAQQLDATFSTTASLDVYGLGLDDTTTNQLAKVASVPTQHRFHKLVWGAKQGSSGLIVGGSDQGLISVYDAGKALNGDSDPIAMSKDKHTGPVGALDFNPFQSNLLASGAAESEIFIWDMNKPQTPMTPGAKSQPLEDVRCVAWNRQVQHILATTFSSRCVVWDLRKNDPIIKVSDNSSRHTRFKVVAWHPEVATQMCIASEDDHNPVIQIWDLRLASAPLRTLESHTRGVLGVAWCQRDADLLLSCGKDNRIICWNPNTNIQGGEVLCELGSSDQWSFDLVWCPRNPAVVATAGFDGKVSVHSLMGGTELPAGPSQPSAASAAIAESFPGMENMQLPSAMVQQQSPTLAASQQLKVPPKWMKRPCGANFAFGGKLISFEYSSEPQQQGKKSMVHLSTVVTDADLVHRSTQLETTLKNGNYSEFCDMKIAQANLKLGDEQVWKFIRANYSEDPRTEFLGLLDYDPVKVGALLSKDLPANASSLNGGGDDGVVNDLANGMGDLHTDGGGSGEEVFDQISAKANEEEAARKPFTIRTGGPSGSSLLSKALLTGNVALAVDICLEQDRFADALILAMRQDGQLLEKVQKKYFAKCAETVNEDDADAGVAPLIEAVVSGDWMGVVQRCDPAQNWKEALAAALTYAYHDPQAYKSICSTVGSRLESLGSLEDAMICHVCAGDLDKVVELWMNTRDTKDSASSDTGKLQDLVEVVMMMRHAGSGANVQSGGPLSTQLTAYATTLASQGALEAALTYLTDGAATDCSDQSVTDLKERLQGAIGAQAVAASAAATAASNRYKKPESSRGTTPGSGWNYGYSAPQARKYSESSGIHNPAQEELYSAPVPHYEHGGITNRRNSRPRNPSVDGSTVGGYNQPSFGAYVPPPTAPAMGYDIMTPAAAAPPPPMAAAPAAPPSIFNPAAAAPSLTSPPMMGSYGGGIGADVLAANERKMQYAQGLTAYEPPKSDGFGWNEPPPPPINTKPKSKPKTTPTAAITQPLMMMTPAPVAEPPGMGGYGAPPPLAATAPPPPPQGYGMPPPVPQQQSYYQPQTSQQESISPYDMDPQYHQQQQPNIMTPQAFQPAAPQAAPAPMTPQPQQQPQPPPPVEKAPIPDEHKVLQEVFETLRAKCVVAANHPQIKRKLEDVAKKLEVLYDKLRENALPQPTLDGLHQIKEYIWAYDYKTCLLVLNQLASTGSFALLSRFIPGIKVLIQVAQQLGVYIERR